MQNGDVPIDHVFLRETSMICRTLGGVCSDDYNSTTVDAEILSLLAMTTRSSEQLSDLNFKFVTAFGDKLRIR